MSKELLIFRSQVAGHYTLVFKVMNKAQWNSVYYTGSVSAELVRELIDHSYELVVQGLKKKDREALEKGDY